MCDNIFFQDMRSGKSPDIGLCSGIGKRDAQQDEAYVIACDGIAAAVLCDGMGGEAGGQLASRRAVETYLNCLSRQKGNLRDPGWMQEAVLQADEEVHCIRTPDGHLLGGGSTLAAVTVLNSSMNWVSVGDSRIYLLREGQLCRITRDHNYFLELDRLYDEGVIREADYRSEAIRGDALISYLGMGGLKLIDRNREPFALQTGDVILLCVDGLYRTVEEAQIQCILEEATDMTAAAEMLEQAIVQAQNPMQDNYTYILMKI